MSVIRHPPEFADRGYWYVVEAVPDPDEGGRTPGDIPSGWCVWYREIDGVVYCANRTPDPVMIPRAADIPASAIVADFGFKPHGRAGGR